MDSKADVFVELITPIERLMNHSLPLANWLVKFASAEFVIAYNPQSQFASDLSGQQGEMPWYRFLRRRIKIWKTDPKL
jgi:molybdate/tungstate transport system substrate-binding protein